MSQSNGSGVEAPLIVLLYRLRHAERDVDWLSVHALISERVRNLNESEVYNQVADYYSASRNLDERIVKRDFKALMLDIFRQP